MKIAIVGAGWAGMAAAVAAGQAGHNATIFEASHAIGGRARALKGTLPDGTPVLLDNGQHIMIGAYSATLQLMRQVGLDPDVVVLRTPLNLQFPDGKGLALPAWPAPLDAVAGICSANGWSAADKWSLVKASVRWQLAGFQCAPATSVSELCNGLSPTVLDTLIDLLCVSALNTPAARASGQVFLRVLKDSLLGGQGASNLLLPTTDLSSLFPAAALAWAQQHGAQLRLGHRVTALHRRADGAPGWQIEGEAFDAVLWAGTSSNAARVMEDSALATPHAIANDLHAWAVCAQALQFEAIATVYAYAPQARLAQPMVSLYSSPSAPAQFVFDRAQLGGPQGLLAFVVSASANEREVLQAQVLSQAREQLGLTLQAVQTVVEKRATFACTPGLRRPAQTIAPQLWACGDYVEGPYPATLEGAVRSGLQAIALMQA